MFGFYKLSKTIFWKMKNKNFLSGRIRGLYFQKVHLRTKRTEVKIQRTEFRPVRNMPVNRSLKANDQNCTNTDIVLVEDLNNLSAGDYTATVTDSNGCETTVEFTISEPDELLVWRFASNSGKIHKSSLIKIL